MREAKVGKLIFLGLIPKLQIRKFLRHASSQIVKIRKFFVINPHIGISKFLMFDNSFKAAKRKWVRKPQTRKSQKRNGSAKKIANLQIATFAEGQLI